MHHGFWEVTRGMNSAFGTFFWGSIILKALFWIAVLVIAYKFFKNYNNKDEKSSSKALEELKLKYVNEEITEEEYKRKKRILEE